MPVTDDQVLTHIYRSAFPRVARMVRRMQGDEQLAKDIFHDALIIFLEKQNDDSTAIRNASTYVTGIARILCIREMRQRRNELPLEAAELHGIPGDFYDPPPVPGNVWQYLRAAGQRCLELLTAFYYHNHSISEIAAGFRFKSLHSASVQKYKCLEKVRNHIKESDYAESAH
jgi:DNA-directed RNA polymerase specialized sigma24 family protein